MSKQFLRTCARTIVIHDGKVLLIKNKFKDGIFWGFPGGVQEELETLEQCAAREAKEETNLAVEIVKPLYLEEFIQPGKKHLVSLWFLARPAKSANVNTVSNGNDPDDQDRGKKILDVKWFPVGDLKGLPMRPSHFIKAILEDHESGFAKIPQGCVRVLPAHRERAIGDHGG